jgi:hypothetical protein
VKRAGILGERGGRVNPFRESERLRRLKKVDTFCGIEFVNNDVDWNNHPLAV